MITSNIKLVNITFQSASNLASSKGGKAKDNIRYASWAAQQISDRYKVSDGKLDVRTFTMFLG